jgi:16S rRNA U516 pseudouridylate synthase RsuA-like enzyme
MASPEGRPLLLDVNALTRLKRVAFGGLELGDLPPGRWREVTTEELWGAFERTGSVPEPV